MAELEKNYLDTAGLENLWAQIKKNFVAGGGLQTDASVYDATWKQRARKNIGLIGKGGSSSYIYFDSNGDVQTKSLGTAAFAALGTAAGNALKLDNSAKIPLSVIPDVILGQLLYGGTVDADGKATLSTNVKTKLGITDAEVQLTNNTSTYGYGKFEGVYFIMSANSSFASLGLLVGDWLISTGTAWKKVDNTDAVTGVKGNSETEYRTGNINITKADIGLGNVENKSASTILGELTGTQIVTKLGTTPVNRATADASGNTITATYATKTQLTDGSVTKVGTSTVGSSTRPIYLNNGVPTAITITEYSSSDYKPILVFNSNGINKVSNIQVSGTGNIVMPNGTALSVKNATGTARNILTYNTSNVLALGYASTTVDNALTQIFGGGIEFRNASSLLGKMDINGGLSMNGGVAAHGVADLTSGSGGGTGTVTSIKLGSTPYSPDDYGVISLPAYPTLLPLTSITGTTNLRVIEGLGAGTTTGLLKKTGANSWEIGGIAYADLTTKPTSAQIQALLGNYVSTFGGQSGAITVDTTTTTNGTVKFAMSSKKLTATVVGLGTAAYTASTAYATAAQGAKADTALQAHQTITLASGTNNGTLKLTTAAGTVDNIAVKGLAAAAYKSVTDNSSSTAVTSTDTNLITARTLYYAGYTKNVGTVTSITLTAGTGISITNSGTAITSSGTRTISLATVGTAGTYQSVTVDAYGRVTAGSNPLSLAVTADSFDLKYGSDQEVQFGTIPTSYIQALSV